MIDLRLPYHGGAKAPPSVRRVVRLAPAVLLVLVSACDSSIKTPEHARKQASKLSSASTRADAEKKLSEAEPSLVQDPLAMLVADAAAPAEARVAAINVLKDNVSNSIILPQQVVDAFGSRDTPEPVRLAALEGMLLSGDPEYLPVLTAASLDGDPLHEKVRAAMPRYADARRAWYRSEMVSARTSAAQMVAVRALADVGTQADVPAIKAAAESGPPQVKYEAILTLAKIGGPVATEHCLAQLESDDPFLRAAAISAAQSLKDARAIPSLEKALRDDGVADNRIGAALALATIGGKEARVALTNGCGNPATNPIRQACKTALKRVQ